MGIENLPNETTDIIDISAKTDLLKIENQITEIKLENYNSVNIQPKGTVFGAKVKVEEDGSLTPTLTFDTKKLRQSKKDIDTNEIVDNAIQEYLNQTDGN